MLHYVGGRPTLRATMARYTPPVQPLTPEAQAWIAATVTHAFDRAFADLGEERSIAFDRATARSFDADGRMHVSRVNFTKANVCPYFGREIPGCDSLGLDPNKIYKLYRDPEELRLAADTFKNIPLLLVHTVISAKNPKSNVVVGTIGTDVAFDAPYLGSSLAVWTDEGIKLIESKKQAELSASYRYRADMTPGTSPEGVAYDGVMRDIMANHVALVERGRAGSDVYVSDSQPLEFTKMFKRPNLLARTIAALVTPPSEEQRLAIDEALAANTAADIAVELAKPAPVVTVVPPIVDKTAMDAAVTAAITAGGFVSKIEATALANDAANSAVARVNALHKAREDVKSLVGVVAMDSATEVYAFALKQSGVATDGIPEGAFGALVEQVKARKVVALPAAGPVKFASDAQAAAALAIPGLGRISVAG